MEGTAITLQGSGTHEGFTGCHGSGLWQFGTIAMQHKDLIL
jgi:hypothetical protein